MVGEERITISRGGILAAMHREGVGAVRSYLRRIERDRTHPGSRWDPRPGYFVNIEGRLRDFRNTDLRRSQTRDVL